MTPRLRRVLMWSEIVVVYLAVLFTLKDRFNIDPFGPPKLPGIPAEASALEVARDQIAHVCWLPAICLAVILLAAILFLDRKACQAASGHSRVKKTV